MWVIGYFNIIDILIDKQDIETLFSLMLANKIQCLQAGLRELKENFAC